MQVVCCFQEQIGQFLVLAAILDGYSTGHCVGKQALTLLPEFGSGVTRNGREGHIEQMDYTLLPHRALLLAHLCLQDHLHQSMKREHPCFRLTLNERNGSQRCDRLVQLVPIGRESRTSKRRISDKEVLRNAFCVEKGTEAEQISREGIFLLDVRVSEGESGGDGVRMILS